MHLRINACQNRVHLNIEAACQEVAMCSGADLAIWTQLAFKAAGRQPAEQPMMRTAPDVHPSSTRYCSETPQA